MVPLGENAEFYNFGGFSSRDGRAGAFYRLPDQEAQVVPQIFPYGMLPYINTGITDQSIGAGVRGTSRGWDVDFSLTHGRNDFQFIIDNTVNASLGAASPTTFDAGRLAFAQTTGNLDLVRPLQVGRLKSVSRSEEHTSELQSLAYLVCRLLLEKKKNTHTFPAQSKPPPTPCPACTTRVT